MYFNLLIKQWEGLFYRYSEYFYIIPYLAFASLIIITLALRGHSSGVTLMALGLASTVAYCIFLVWLALNKPFS